MAKQLSVEQIEKAFQDKRVIAVYQPILNNRLKEITKFETLVRIRDENISNENLIAPFFFLETAKRHNKAELYFKITKEIITQSFLLFKERNESFSINISIMDILNDDITDFLFAEIEKNNIARQLVIEITEEESIESNKEKECLKSFIVKCKSIGCKLSLDDFGSGFSNFVNLIEFQFDYLKIDGSIIKNIVSCHKSRDVAEAITVLARQMGCEVVAEYIENAQILSIVHSLDIEYSQGYEISEPVEIIDKLYYKYLQDKKN